MVGPVAVEEAENVRRNVGTSVARFAEASGERGALDQGFGVVSELLRGLLMVLKLATYLCAGQL